MSPDFGLRQWLRSGDPKLKKTELEFDVPELRQLGMHILFGNLELERVLNAAGSHPLARGIPYNT